VNTLTGTSKKIWVAKKAQTGEASCSRKSVLDTLIDSLGGDSSHTLPGTELVLGSAQQTMPPSSLPSVTLPSASSPPVTVTGNSSMAYQRADPQPFAPQGFQMVEVQHREPMVRAVIRDMQPTHEDYAIVSITPLLNNQMHFAAVHEVVHDFFKSICKLGSGIFSQPIWVRI
jgi:hypothetical protein